MAAQAKTTTARKPRVKRTTQTKRPVKSRANTRAKKGGTTQPKLWRKFGAWFFLFFLLFGSMFAVFVTIFFSVPAAEAAQRPQVNIVIDAKNKKAISTFTSSTYRYPIQRVQLN